MATRRIRRSAGGNTSTTLGATTLLPQFLALTGTLTTAERNTLVEQAEVMLEQLYVHLPLKRSMHATDPIQRLRLAELPPRGTL